MLLCVVFWTITVRPPSIAAMSFFSSPTPSPEAPRIPPPLPPHAPVASSSRASSSRQGSITSDSFLSRLEATASPAGAGRRSRYAASDATGRDRDAEAEEEMDEEGPVGDVERMARAWVKERGTGDILAWEGDVVDSLFDKLEQQVRPPPQLLRFYLESRG